MTRLRRSEFSAASARLVAKEFRALATPFALSLIAVAGLTAFSSGARYLALPAYYFATVTLGALSVGHEYTYRTLGMLLAQPVSRSGVLWAKLVVVVPMVLALLIVATVTLRLAPGDSAMVLLWMPPVAALCLAPWLTMLCRNVIAGAVFSAGLPGGLWAVCELTAFAIHGETRQADELKFVLYWIAASGVCATGAILGVRTFLALEAVDGSDAPLQFPRWLDRTPATGAATARHRSALWMLVKKELHLQQMTFIVAGIYVGVFTAIWMSSESASLSVRDAFTVVSAFYAFMLAVLAGAVSSAEERHLGTIQWQLMLPFPASRQWGIKVVVSLTLALLLAVGLPTVFAGEFNPTQPRFIAPILIVTSCAIYISSRTPSGIHALLVAFVTVALVTVLVREFVGAYIVLLGGERVITLAGLAIAVVALRLGLNHYRTLHRSTIR